MKGLVLLFTGNGKGKTTAALGQALRAAGQGLKVCFIQFIKGSWQTGEQRIMALFKDRIDFFVKGSGFTWQAEDRDELIRETRKAFDFAGDKISSGEYDMVILDELTYLVKYGMVKEGEVVKMIRNRPETQHLVITGRDASDGLITVADLVTEMREIKHPFSQGIKARKGIEF
ncbi:MAG: cob(I)yrinic acid a,c-diamide adenosyltransferase [Thermodesulfobacteriota bacterium]|nr:cob(I)yrinic acid a,c-diamide adenosyltransferase [Thermodesulfobacteriota bacterium]